MTLRDTNVLLKPIAYTQTSGGFLMPESKPEPLATVVQVGPGTIDFEMELQVGDTVVYDQRQATSVTIEGEKYLICDAKNIPLYVRN